jgi:hypothetical protein
MVGIKMKLLSFLSGSLRNFCYFIFSAGRSSNGRTYPSGGYYLGSSPSLPALNRKSEIGKGIWRMVLGFESLTRSKEKC